MKDYSYFIPGYAGFCPVLRDRVGQTYGNATRQILSEKPHLKKRLAPVLYGFRRYGKVSQKKENRSQQDQEKAAGFLNSKRGCSGLVNRVPDEHYYYHGKGECPSADKYCLEEKHSHSELKGIPAVNFDRHDEGKCLSENKYVLPEIKEHLEVYCYYPGKQVVYQKVKCHHPETSSHPEDKHDCKEVNKGHTRKEQKCQKEKRCDAPGDTYHTEKHVVWRKYDHPKVRADYAEKKQDPLNSLEQRPRVIFRDLNRTVPVNYADGDRERKKPTQKCCCPKLIYVQAFSRCVPVHENFGDKLDFRHAYFPSPQIPQTGMKEKFSDVPLTTKSEGKRGYKTKVLPRIKPHRQGGVIPKYTGHIPGMQFSFGESFGPASDRLLQRHHATMQYLKQKS